MDVLIADDRPDWMKKEDEVIVCRTRCSFFKSCSSRFGSRCKKLGGSEIPKINNRKERMNHARCNYLEKKTKKRNQPTESGLLNKKSSDFPLLF